MTYNARALLADLFSIALNTSLWVNPHPDENAKEDLDLYSWSRLACSFWAYSLVDWVINSKISLLIKSVNIAYGLSRSKPLGSCSRGGSEAGVNSVKG